MNDYGDDQSLRSCTLTAELDTAETASICSIQSTETTLTSSSSTNTALHPTAAAVAAHPSSLPSTLGGGGQLTYERVIQDYVRLRSKLVVLKKAYVELSETGAHKDQALRKYEQEIEALNFRNQQLMTRVELLQKDLDQCSSSSVSSSSSSSMSSSASSPPASASAASSSSSSSSSSLLADLTRKATLGVAIFPSPSSSSSTPLLSSSSSTTSSSSTLSSKGVVTNHMSELASVLGEELQHKISENASLHRRLNDMEVEFTQRLATNDRTLKLLEHEKLVLEERVEADERRASAQLDKLQSEKHALELRLVQLEQMLRAAYEEREGAERLLRADNQQLRQQLQQQQQQHEQEQEQEQATKTEAHTETTVVISANNAPNEVALSQCLSDMAHVAAQLYACVHDHQLASAAAQNAATACESQLAKHLTPLYTSATSAAQFIQFMDANHSLLQSIADELVADASPSHMLIVNKKLRIYVNKLNALCFAPTTTTTTANMRSSVMRLLASEADNDEAIKSSQGQQQQLVAAQLDSIHDLLDKLLFALGEKLTVSYAHSTPAHLTTSYECIVAHVTELRQLVANAAKLVRAGGHVEHLLASLLASIRQREQRAAAVAVVEENREEVVVAPLVAIDRVELDVCNQKIARQEDELNALRQEFAAFQMSARADLDRVERMDAQYERLQLEHAELTRRYGEQLDELTRLRAHLEQLQAGASSATPSNTHVHASDTVRSLRRQVTELTKRLFYVDAKAVHYHDEACAAVEQVRAQLAAGVEQASALSEVSDQLERTRTSYETQLSAMSEHLIERNDELARLRDDNDNMRHHIQLLLNNATTTTTNNANGHSNKIGNGNSHSSSSSNGKKAK